MSKYKVLDREKLSKDFHKYCLQIHHDRVERKSYMYFNQYKEEYIYIEYSRVVTNATTKYAKGLLHRMVNDGILGVIDSE